MRNREEIEAVERFLGIRRLPYFKRVFRHRREQEALLNIIYARAPRGDKQPYWYVRG